MSILHGFAIFAMGFAAAIALYMLMTSHLRASAKVQKKQYENSMPIVSTNLNGARIGLNIMVLVYQYMVHDEMGSRLQRRILRRDISWCIEALENYLEEEEDLLCELNDGVSCYLRELSNGEAQEFDLDVFMKRFEPFIRKFNLRAADWNIQNGQLD